MKLIVFTLFASSLVATLVAADAYVQSDGSQVIDTGYCATPATRVDIDFAYDDLAQQQRPFGNQGVDAGLTFTSYISGGSVYSWGCKDGDGDWLWSKIAVSKDRVRIVLDSFAGKHEVYTGGALADSFNLTAARTKNAVYPMALFGVRTGPGATAFSNLAKMKLYSMKVSEGGTLVHEYVPYQRNGVAGVKDLVTGRVLGPLMGSPLRASGVADETVGYVWTGAADADWANPANWEVGGAAATQAPTSCDDVTVPAGATVSLANLATPVHSLTFSGSGAVSFSGTPAAALAESLAVPAGVTLALDAGSLLYVPTASYNGAALAADCYTGATAAWLSGAGTLAAGQVPRSLVDGVLTYNVPAGITQLHTDVLTAEITKVVKLGAGTLVVSNDNNTAFSGNVEIREGILEAQSAVISDGTTTVPVFGRNAANTYTVSKGAQLRVRCPGPTSQAQLLIKGTLVIAGSGPDGNGALYYVKAAGGNANVDNVFSNVRLTDDASFGNSSRCGFSYGTLDLGGHTLTHRLLQAHTSMFMNTGGTVKNGTLCITNGSDYILQGSPRLNADATLEIGKNSFLDSWSASPAFAGWTVMKDGARFRVGAGTGENNNKISGPVRLDGSMNFTTYSTTANMRATLAGHISGTGRVCSVIGSNYSGSYATTQHLYITCPTNSWTGGVAADYGDIWATVAGSIPPGPLTSSNGRLNLMAGPGAWDFASIHNILTNWNGTGAVNVYTAKGQSLTDDVDLARWITYRHGGPGELAFAAKVPADGKTSLINGEGTLHVRSCGETRYLTELKAAGGTLDLTDAGFIYAGESDGAGKPTITNKTFTVGGANNVTNARMVVAGATILGAYEAPGQKKGGFLYVGDTGSKGAILEVRAGAVVTNGLHVGENGAKGAVHQFGGSVRDTSVAGNDGSIGHGNGAYGYYGLYDGTYSVRAWQALGRSKGAEGVFEQTGGEFRLTDAPFCISRGGYGEYHMTGGSFVQTSTADPCMYLGNFSWADKSAGPMEAVLTLAGDNPQMTLKTSISLSERTNTAVSVVNLNAGVLTVPNFAKRHTGFADTSLKVSGFKDVYAYINFNGGTFRGTKAHASVFGDGVNRADAVTVFGGGATVDVNGKALSNGAVPFSKPLGKGIAAIALPAGAKLDGYIGAPKVYITGGGGAGATAHCAFDARTGRIGPITVVSPGWGYTAAPTVTVKSGDRASTLTCTATLTEGDAPAGGLTVMDSSDAKNGVFTLTAANTYAGPTVVAGGTLKVGAADALPAGGEVRCAGGTLDLNNLGTLTVGAFGGFGSVVNGDVVADSLSFTAEGCGRTLDVSGALTLPAAAPVHVSGVTASFETKKYVLLTAAGGISGSVGEVTGFDAFEHPNLWRVSKSGNSIILTYSRGTALILR